MSISVNLQAPSAADDALPDAGPVLVRSGPERTAARVAQQNMPDTEEKIERLSPQYTNMEWRPQSSDAVRIGAANIITHAIKR